MTDADYRTSVLEAHVRMRAAIARVDMLADKLEQARKELADAEGRLRQLARTEVK